MEKCKIKAIQADLDTFKHIQAYSDIFRHNEACPGITQVYSKPLCNPRIFRTLVYSEPEIYSEL